MKPRTVAVLAVLVAALAAFVWFVDRDLPSSEERAAQAKKLLRIDPDDVTGVIVEWQGKSVRMEKSAPPEAGADGQEGASAVVAPAASPRWRIVEPLDARADGAEVDRLLEALTGLEHRRAIEDADPAAVGLDAPRGQVTLQTVEDGGQRESEQILRVGAAVPTSDEVLVSVSSDGAAPRTFVTSGSFLDQLERQPGDWRAKDVFTAARNAVERLTLSSAGAPSPVVLARRDERFRIEAPVSDLADPDRVDDLLSGLVTLRVKRFVDAPAEAGADSAGRTDRGLDPPRETLQADLEGGETFRLDLGAPVPGAGSGAGGAGTVYAKVGDQMFTATTDLPDSVGLSAAEWRSPGWTALRSFQIEQLDLTQGETTFNLRRDGSDWQRDGETIPYAAASDLLSAITGAEGQVVDRTAAQPGEALLTVQITLQEGDPVTLTLYPEGAAGFHLAGSSERPSLVRLSAKTVSSVLDAVSAVRDAEPEKSAGDGPAEPDAAGDP